MIDIALKVRILRNVPAELLSDEEKDLLGVYKNIKGEQLDRMIKDDRAGIRNMDDALRFFMDAPAEEV